MKDSIITARRKKTEIITFLLCFVLANLANLYAIIAHKTPFIEIFTSIGFVVAASIVIYILWTFLRLIFYFLRKCLKKTNVK
jgi:O-antigen/teichoic acid export membrane protein